MEDYKIEEIKKLTTKSVFYLSFRNFGIQIIATLGFFLLTILLGAGEVGLFAIVAESISILGYFSDIGLASALIQHKEQVEDKDLQTTFTVQQILVFLGLLIVALIYPRIAIPRHYGSKEFWILLSLCFAFLCSSLKTIPSVLLERKLNFQKLSLIDMVENLLFYIIAVAFAFAGFGAVSYAIATFIKSIVGLVLIYQLQSWPIGISFSFPSLKKLLHFGIPFQLNSFIALAKDRLSNLLVAGIVGREAFGLLSWAQKGSRIPLSFMDAIMKVTFPTFSRIQNDLTLLQKSISRSIYFIALVVFPSLLGIALVAADLVALIPKYGKWQPALMPLYFYALSFAIAAVTTPITNAFNAVGKIKITTKLMIMWTVLTWIFYPILSLKFGYIGTSVAALLVGLSSVFSWLLCQKHFQVNIFSTVAKPFLASLLILIVCLPLNSLFPSPFYRFASKTIVGILVYSLFQWRFSRPEIIWFLSQTKWLKKDA
jgi:O-antigen/teichoic acid export membrane protein